MPSSSTPLLSVGIPTYCGEAHIKKAMDSVLSQSFSDFELVILDNCSTDRTLEMVASYADPRIRVVRNPTNLGAERNWNRFLAEARGKYLKLLPQDDLLAAGCLEAQVRVLETDSQEKVALVFSARQILLPDGRYAMRRGYPGRSRPRYLSASDLVRACIRGGTNLIGEPGAVMFRRSLMQIVGDFDARYPYVIDLEYWFRLLAHGDAYYLPEAYSYFTVSNQSWSRELILQQGRDFRRLANEVAGNEAFDVHQSELLIGSLRAEINNVLRLIFYRFI